MPIYVYECKTCKDSIELLRPVSRREEPVLCAQHPQTMTIWRERVPTAPAAFQVHGFSSANGYTGARTFVQHHTEGRLKGIRSETKGNPEGFADGLHA